MEKLLDQKKCKPEKPLFQAYSGYSRAIHAENNARKRQQLEKEQKALLHASKADIDGLIVKHRKKLETLIERKQKAVGDAVAERYSNAVLIESTLLDDLILLAMHV